MGAASVAAMTPELFEASFRGQVHRRFPKLQLRVEVRNAALKRQLGVSIEAAGTSNRFVVKVN